MGACTKLYPAQRAFQENIFLRIIVLITSTKPLLWGCVTDGPGERLNGIQEVRRGCGQKVGQVMLSSQDAADIPKGCGLLRTT